MAMFDAVRKGFDSAVNGLRGKQEITEANIDEALRTIRMALFEADVNFRVVKDFLAKVKEKSVGEIVQVRVKADGEKIRVSAGDVFIKICHDELEELMGPADSELTLVNDRMGPTVIMMVGLQGAGKTTTTGKLARWLIHHHQKKPLLIGADVYRPAAIEQLRVLGERLDVPVFAEEGGNPPEVAARGLAEARSTGRDVVIIDTAGRLAVDDLLMSELEEIRNLTKPHNILLVVDAMIGQDAVNTAHEFNKRLELDGFIMTKLDGDARGGAALSIKQVTGKPIKFVGMGEGMDALQTFQPSGFADRILGMGDVRSLVGRMENIITEQEAEAREKDAERMLKGDFDFYDFLEQIHMIRKMGSLTEILDMMPFGNQMPAGANVDDNELVRIESMIQSMTAHERKHPDAIISQVSRRRRIAKGSGRKESDVSDLVQRFNMMKNMLTQFGQGGGGMMANLPGFKQLNMMRQMKNMNMNDLFGAMGGGAGAPGGMPTMPGMGGGAAPQLPPGITPPGQRMTSRRPEDAKAKIDKAKERRKRRKARDARKKSRRK